MNAINTSIYTLPVPPSPAPIVFSMPHTYFFYDIETSGLSRAHQRTIQFAGQRTDLDLNPIGKPFNILVRMHEDVLPDPSSLRVNGKTPQEMRNAPGAIDEPEFCRILMEEIFLPGTISAGFNNIRFDDNFIRQMLWRNFYDPYEWAYKSGRGRWDVFNMMMTFRALRPEGIKWPFSEEDGRPINTLESVCAINGLLHENAHDALADIQATIDLVKLMRSANIKLYDWFLSLREKAAMEAFISKGTSFVFMHRTFGPERLNAALVAPIYKTVRGEMMVYDLMQDPADFIGLDDESLRRGLFEYEEKLAEDGLRSVPVKRLTFNQNPGVAPASILRSSEEVRTRLGIDLDVAQSNFEKLQGAGDFFERVKKAFAEHSYDVDPDVEGQIYEGFPTSGDKDAFALVRKWPVAEIANCNPVFDTPRFNEIFVRYKARNAGVDSLTESEKPLWDAHMQRRWAPSQEWLDEWQEEYETADDALKSKLDDLMTWTKPERIF